MAFSFGDGYPHDRVRQDLCTPRRILPANSFLRTVAFAFLAGDEDHSRGNPFRLKAHGIVPCPASHTGARDSSFLTRVFNDLHDIAVHRNPTLGENELNLDVLLRFA